MEREEKYDSAALVLKIAKDAEEKHKRKWVCDELKKNLVLFPKTSTQGFQLWVMKYDKAWFTKKWVFLYYSKI
jgi:hypothetical protein